MKLVDKQYYKNNNILSANLDQLEQDTIPYMAFYRCHNMSNVILPNSLKSIQMEAFEDCKKLISIEIPDNVEYIGKYAFRRCYNLSTVILHDNILSIDDGIFEGCCNLLSIHIPENLKYIHSCAFVKCHKLTNIQYNIKQAALLENAIDNI